MCLTVSIENSKVRVAEEDIVVYKILDKETGGKLISPYQYAEYKLNEVRTAKLGDPQRFNNFSVAIEEGLHSSADLKEANNLAYYLTQLPSNNDLITHTVVCKAIIPKGAEYYFGKFNHHGASYASSQLIVQEEITQLPCPFYQESK